MIARTREGANHSLAWEEQALLCAAHPALSTKQELQFAWVPTRRLDWPDLIADAERHGVAALLYCHLLTLSLCEMPQAVLDDLAHCARICLIWNLRLRYELGTLLAAFSQGGIPVMPLKGPVLADLLYPDPFLRSTADLDILVQHDDVATAERVLQNLGYLRLPPHEQGADYHTLFMSQSADAACVVVELHWELGERHVSGLDIRTIWAAASRTSWEGHQIWSMAVPDLLLYLCIHAVKDGLASVKGLLDITLLAERYGHKIPWNDLIGQVKAAHLSSPIYLSLSQSRALLGAPVPEEFLESIRPRHLSWRLSEALFRWRGGVLHVPPKLLVGPVMAILMFFWEDSLRGKFRHLRRNLIPAPDLRARWTSLPLNASFLRWYPAWIWRAGCSLLRQLVLR